MSLLSRMFVRLSARRGNMRNGLYPNAATWATLVQAQNHSMAFRHREIYRRSWEFGVASAVSGTSTIGRFRFRTGYGVTKITYVVIMGIDNGGGVGPPLGANPYLDIETTLSGGGTTTTSFHAGQAAVNGNDSPEEQILLAEDVTVTPNSVYTVAIKSQDYGRPLAICAYEQADLTVTESTDYYNTMNPIAAHPIYDADRQRLVQGINNMWKRGGGATWHWHLLDGSARTRTSATHINILDNSTTGTPATSDYGFYLDLAGHNTLSATTVPFELAAYGNVSGGGDGEVRLIDTAGNVYGNAAISSGTDAWHTATINLPTASTFYAAQFASDGAATTSISAISLIEYTA